MAKQCVLSSASKNVSANPIAKYNGPREVTRVLSPLVYEITFVPDDETKKVPVADLKPYRPWTEE